MYLDFQFIFSTNILLFNTSFESIVFKIIFCHIFIYSVDKFVNKKNCCLFTYSILKNILFFQLFLKIGSKPVYFYSLKLWLYVIETLVPKKIFIFNIVLDLNNNFIYMFFLILKFDIIF